MKTMKKIVMLLAAVALLAAGAQAQVKFGRENQAYVIENMSEASVDAGSVSYEWYINGELISDCNGMATCTVPAGLCYGTDVEFKRKAVAEGCIGNSEGYSETVIVSFKCGGGHGTRIGSLCWADRNVGAAGAFTATADEYSPFYQWNRSKAWAASGSVSNWIDIPDQAATWTVNPHPCPTGWQLPSQAEFQTLLNLGSTWVASGRGTSVAGRFFGPNHANANGNCTLPNNMSGCIFLPASGFRNSAINSANQGNAGYYWSSTQYNNNSNLGYFLNLGNSGTAPTVSAFGRAIGLSLRCVQ